MLERCGWDLVNTDTSCLALFCILFNRLKTDGWSANHIAATHCFNECTLVHLETIYRRKWLCIHTHNMVKFNMCSGLSKMCRNVLLCTRNRPDWHKMWTSLLLSPDWTIRLDALGESRTSSFILITLLNLLQPCWCGLCIQFRLWKNYIWR